MDVLKINDDDDDDDDYQTLQVSKFTVPGPHFSTWPSLCSRRASLLLLLLVQAILHGGHISIPLLKKKDLDKDDPKNYRPITNLVTISKILERLASSRL